MVIDEGLLRQAREAGARVADAQHEADLAKANYHHAVRLLHFAGASMREVADALELSHQRVHQIIEATGGTGGWRTGRNPPDTMACSVCGLTSKQVTKLIAGPKIFICDRCVLLARAAADTSAAAENSLARIDPVPAPSQLKCSFCGKQTAIVAGTGLCICAGCIDLCEQVLAAAR